MIGSREESIAGLWAYVQTLGGPVSRQPGAPVTKVALAIGWAVKGVYNKVMNFRHLDPRDERQGLSGRNQVDVEVWDEFFDSEQGSLNQRLLTESYEDLWGQQFSEGPNGQREKPRYEEFGEAPDDDPEDLYRFATRVRRGQPKFRENLLSLYQERCAVTGAGPPEVLEAAHIVRHAESGINEVDNGLLLRADIHYLFDTSLLKIHPETLVVTVHKKLKETQYETLVGQRLRERTDGGRPAAEYLSTHWSD